MIATMGRTTSNCDLHTRPSNAFSQAISPRPTSFLIRDILGKGDPGSEESHHNVTCDARLSLSNEALDDDSDCYSPQTIGDRGTCKKENYQFEERPSSQLNTPDGTFEAESNFDLTFDRSRISYCNAGELSTRYSDIKKLRLDEKHISRLHRHKSREEFRSDSSEKDFVSKNICLSESTASNSPFASRQLLKRVEKEEYSSETSGPQRSFLKRSDDDLHNGHPFIGNLLVSPANYPLLDLRYGYALGANGAVAMPHLSHMLLGYQNASLVSPNFSTVYNEYIERAKNLISSRTLLSSSIPHQGPRYTLKEPWVKENHISPHLQVHHHGTSPISEKRNFYPDSCDISSDQAPSPCSSSFSSATPPPKPAVHLPAYLRSRLSGANSSSDVETVGANGKSKKCRRSRTVFTELQMLGLEKRFEKQQYLSTPDRVELAELLGLSQLQVKTWYQNRRMKWKKQVLQGGGTEAPTKPKGRPRKIRPEDQANLGNKASQQLNLSKDQCVKSTSPLIINPVT